MLSITRSLFVVATALAVVSAQAQDHFARVPKNKVQRVLLISIDGFQQADLEAFVTKFPNSTIADLTNSGVQFTNAQTTNPSDSFPGLMAQLTGGTPKTTGVWYDNSYDRSVYPVGSNCTGPIGAQVDYEETMNFNETDLNGGGGLNPALMPLRLNNGKCEPIWPHMYPRVNNIFEVVKKHGGVTAWTDKHLVYDIARGPSGNGLTDLYTPEIASVDKTFAATLPYDQLHANAMLRWINGTDSTGTKKQPVPTVFGGNFQVLSVAQKATGVLSPDTGVAMAWVDNVFKQIVDALKAKKLDKSTVIIISAKHGQSPRDPAQLKRVDPDLLDSYVGEELVHSIGDDAGLFWLKDQSKTFAAASNLYNHANDIHLTTLWAGAGVKMAGLGDPATDPRVPDIVIQSEPGTLFSLSKKKVAEHGGANPDDRHVALLISSPLLRGRKVTTPVLTTQIAPTILQLLNLNPKELQAVKIEGTQSLPIF